METWLHSSAIGQIAPIDSGVNQSGKSTSRRRCYSSLTTVIHHTDPQTVKSVCVKITHQFLVNTNTTASFSVNVIIQFREKGGPANNIKLFPPVHQNEPIRRQRDELTDISIKKPTPAAQCVCVCVLQQTDIQASHVRQIILHSGRKLIQHTHTHRGH